MPTIYAASTDGRTLAVASAGGGWAAVRDVDTASSVVNTGASSTTAVGVFGGGQYRIARAFFAFDTSAIVSRVQSATISIYGINGAGSDCHIIGVEATKPSTSSNVASADHDAIEGWTDGASASGNVTDYTSEVTSWDSTGYNEITLTADALAHLQEYDTFKICFLEHDYDYSNVDPGTSHGATFVGMSFQESTGTSKDPKIVYTLATVAKIDGVATGDISKVDAIAKGSIADIDDFDL